MLNLVARRNWFYIVSALILVPGIISLLIPPRLKPGIEFTSGTTFSFRYADTADRDAVEALLAEPRQRPVVKANRHQPASSPRLLCQTIVIRPIHHLLLLIRHIIFIFVVLHHQVAPSGSCKLHHSIRGCL